MTRFAIALGSNQGDRMDHLRRAVAEIDELGSVEEVSALYETEPVGGPAQARYLNAVVVLETTSLPQDLLTALHRIEAVHHREREERWGPRTLDLDIVAMGGTSIRAPDLEIPHPRAAERRFVLDPLCDVWPDAMVGDGLTAAAAAARADVTDQEVVRLAANWLEDEPDR
jgi:dihydroneopterin aldolase/2-amino-4-hydroxy-6-hydroxymethyldihydropteridine diphosphokinase